MIKVAINGFGRIGRNTLRAALKDKEHGKKFEIVAINDLANVKTLAHLFKYDSVFGTFEGEIKAKDNKLKINDNEIAFFSEVRPSNLPWSKLGIDAVIESTGMFRKKEDAAQHLKAGAKYVIISAPAKDPDVTTIVLGVNEETFDPERDKIVSMASCTTNSLAPPLKVLNNKFGIERAFMTTIHAYTSNQRILDFPHKDLRRARAAALSIIPTTTGAAKAIGRVLPELDGKIDGLAMRVPVPDGSITDITAMLKQEVTKEDINRELKRAADNELNGIMDYTEEPIVSVDIIGNPHSAIIDGLSTNTIGNLAKVLSWYDNEWGYSCRLVDLVKYMFK